MVLSSFSLVTGYSITPLNALHNTIDTRIFLMDDIPKLPYCASTGFQVTRMTRSATGLFLALDMTEHEICLVEREFWLTEVTQQRCL